MWNIQKLTSTNHWWCECHVVNLYFLLPVSDIPRVSGMSRELWLLRFLLPWIPRCILPKKYIFKLLFKFGKKVEFSVYGLQDEFHDKYLNFGISKKAKVWTIWTLSVKIVNWRWSFDRSTLSWKDNLFKRPGIEFSNLCPTIRKSGWGQKSFVSIFIGREINFL